MEIFDTNDSFDFEKLVLTKPTSIPGGNYFIRFLTNGQPLYIQPPKCKTRQGVVKAGKRFYSDLMFTNENEDFIRWMENLENYCQQYIYKNREKWFEGEMELHDIENYFTSPLKLFKSGKYYIARTNITTVLGKPTLKIYDENEKEIDFENISDDTNVMTILEIQGIKCSAKSFQIEVELKQMMVLQPTDIFEKCIIKSNLPVNVTGDSPGHTDKDSNEVEESAPEDDKDIVPKISIDDEIVNDNEDKIHFGESAAELEDVGVHTSLSEESGQVQEPSCADDTLTSDQEIGTCPEKLPGDENSLEEVEFHLEDFNDSEPIIIKNRNNVYYEMYKEARKKAKIARDVALSTYLEAKRIKNTYMLEDLDEDESSDEDDESDDDDEDEDEEDKDEEEDV